MSKELAIQIAEKEASMVYKEQAFMLLQNRNAYLYSLTKELEARNDKLMNDIKSFQKEVADLKHKIEIDNKIDKSCGMDEYLENLPICPK